MRILKRIGLFFLDVIEVFIVAGAIFIIVYFFLFQPHQVQGNSMFPNFHNREYILTDKISYRFHEPERGDIVIFKPPGQENYEFIKRIIGLPGENLKINGGEVYINERRLEETYLQDSIFTRPGSFMAEGETVSVGENQYFVMGDNRSFSSDSRDWGFVPAENVAGKAWIRYWPPSEAGVIKDYHYSF